MMYERVRSSVELTARSLQLGSKLDLERLDAKIGVVARQRKRPSSLS